MKHFPQYTLNDIYQDFNASTLAILIKGLSLNEYDDKMFIAKCHGLEVKEEKKTRPMEKKDWKLFAQAIKKSEEEYRRGNRI